MTLSWAFDLRAIGSLSDFINSGKRRRIYVSELIFALYIVKTKIPILRKPHIVRSHTAANSLTVSNS